MIVERGSGTAACGHVGATDVSSRQSSAMRRPFRPNWNLPARLFFLAGLVSGLSHAAAAELGGRTGRHPPEPLVGSALAERLVEQLGAPSYDRRERAAALLKEIGAEALPSLRRAARHNDLEVRYRARRLLDTIEQSERQRILSEFVTGEDRDWGNLLPGWRRYAGIVGRDASARALFAAMHHDEPEIMRLTNRRGPELRTAVERRVLQFRRSKRNSTASRMSPATVAVLLFVMLDPQLDISGAAHSVMAVVFGQRAVRDELRSSGDSALRRLLSRWIADAADVSPAQRVAIAVQYGVASGVEPSLQLIRSQAKGSQMQNAIFALAKLGGPEHLNDLEALLADDSILSQRQGPAKSTARDELWLRVRETARSLDETTALSLDFRPSPPQSSLPQQGGGRIVFRSQVRDVALAAMISLIGQNPRDYGFTELRPHKDYLYAANTAGFSSDEHRNRALRKWALWAKVQRLQSLSIDEIAVEGVGL